MVSLDPFRSLDKPQYERNAGRIKDVDALNQAIDGITRDYESDQLIAMFNAITVPISKIKSVPEVVLDPLVERSSLFSVDRQTGLRIILTPPPYMTPYLHKSERTMTFPPRFGEHNAEIYGRALGYSDEAIEGLKEKGVI